VSRSALKTSNPETTKETLSRTSVHHPARQSNPQENSHLNKIKRDTNIPSRQRLIRVQADAFFSFPSPFTHIRPLPSNPRVTATFRPEHQHGRRDPEEENDSFGHEAECGARGGAAGEGVRGEVMCY